MIKYDVAKYGTKFLIGTALLGAYNVLVAGQSFSSSRTWYDAASFGASNIISNAVNDLLYDFLHMNNQGLFPMLTEPLLNMVIYQYMYDNITRPNYSGLSGERSRNGVMLIGGLGNVILRFVENPILGLWGMKGY